MKKQDIVQSINVTNWSDDTANKRIPSRDTQVGLQLLNAAYSDTPVFQFSGTNPAGNPVLFESLGGNNYSYQILVWKEGGTVHLSGWVRNLTGTTVPSANLLKMTNDEYFPTDIIDPSTGTTYLSEFIGRTPNGTECRMAVGFALVGGTSTPILRVSDSFAPNNNTASKYYFKTDYKTKF